VGVTIVTGASSGIGRSLARRLAAGGEAVALLARRKELLESLAASIGAEGGRALAIACDVTEPEQVQRAVARTQAELGPVDRLVANAGGGEPSFVDHFEAQQLANVIALNVLGTAHCIEAVLPGMLARGSGHLVATSSLAAYRGLPTGAAYSAAKAALTNMMESLRIDLRPRGIDVTVLLPGFVRTAPSKKKKKESKPFRLELEDATARMARAIEQRRPRYAFPAPLVAVAALGRLLPAPLYDRLISGRGRGAAPKDSA
jgi:short-subunit dehydrogenase